MATPHRRTAHLMTNHLLDFDAGGDTASGTLLCAARHLMKVAKASCPGRRTQTSLI